MKKLPLPLVRIGGPIIAVIAWLIVYEVISYFSKDKDLAKTAASGVFSVTLTRVYNYLKNVEIKLRFLQTGAGTPGADQSVLRWPVMLVYGTLIYLGVIELFGGLEGLITGYFLGAGQQQILPILLVNNYLIWPLFAFVLGRWIGRKCNRFGGLILPVIVILTYIANIASTFLLPESVLQASLNQSKQEILAGIFTLQSWLIFYLPGIILQIVSGSIGLWHGYRTRSSARLVDLWASCLTPPSRPWSTWCMKRPKRLSRSLFDPWCSAPLRHHRQNSIFQKPYHLCPG